MPRGRAELSTSHGAAPSLAAAHHSRAPAQHLPPFCYFMLHVLARLQLEKAATILFSSHNHQECVSLHPSVNLAPGEKASPSKGKALETNSEETQVNSGHCTHLHEAETGAQGSSFSLTALVPSPAPAFASLPCGEREYILLQEETFPVARCSNKPFTGTPIHITLPGLNKKPVNILEKGFYSLHNRKRLPSFTFQHSSVTKGTSQVQSKLIPQISNSLNSLEYQRLDKGFLIIHHKKKLSFQREVKGIPGDLKLDLSVIRIFPSPAHPTEGPSQPRIARGQEMKALSHHGLRRLKIRALIEMERNIPRGYMFYRFN